MTDESTTPSATGPATGPTDRAEALVDRVSELKVPNQTSVVEQRILWASIACAVVGVIAIWIGYWGASGTDQVWKEIPYVVSGGIFGIGLLAAGAVLFARWSLAGLFRFWLARTLTEQQVQTDRLVEAVEQLERAVLGTTDATARVAAPVPAPAAARAVRPAAPSPAKVTKTPAKAAKAPAKITKTPAKATKAPAKAAKAPAKRGAAATAARSGGSTPR